MHFLDQLLLLIIIKLHVPFGQSRLPRSVLDEDEADLCNEIRKTKQTQNLITTETVYGTTCPRCPGDLRRRIHRSRLSKDAVQNINSQSFIKTLLSWYPTQQRY